MFPTEPAQDFLPLRGLYTDVQIHHRARNPRKIFEIILDIAEQINDTVSSTSAPTRTQKNILLPTASQPRRSDLPSAMELRLAVLCGRRRGLERDRCKPRRHILTQRGGNRDTECDRGAGLRHTIL